MAHVKQTESLNYLVDAQANGAAYVSYLYGSSVAGIGFGRDIDVVVIIANGAATRHLLSIPAFGITERLANIYFVPLNDFIDDCSGKFGGYYCEKFSLNFSIIGTGGQTLDFDPPLYYWQHIVNALNIDPTSDTLSLTREVHRNIVKFKPLFAAPLTKFLRSSSRILALSQFIDRNRVDIFSALPQPAAAMDEDANRIYWREYSFHKDGNILDYSKTQQKMDKLKNEIDQSLVSQYFHREN